MSIDFTSFTPGLSLAGGLVIGAAIGGGAGEGASGAVDGRQHKAFCRMPTAGIPTL